MDDALLNYLKKIRQALHQIPELGLQEFKTQSFILNELKSLGYSPFIVAKTGVGVFINYGASACTAFRADMDGLEITEETDCNFKSIHPSFMHACGHDGHMTILLGLAKLLKNTQLKNNILLLFQPAEEGPGGANIICNENILKDFNVKEIYGLHLFPDLDEGVISTKSGPFFAEATEFDCEIIGKGGHGGLPNLTIDPLIPFTKIIDSYQSIISRNFSPFSPAVITIGKFYGGTARNIISNSIKFYGTIRTYSSEDTKFIIKRIEEIHSGYEKAFNVTINSKFRILYPPVINSEILFEKFKKISNNFNFILGCPLMTAEDFSFYQQKIPGLFFLLGTKNEEKNFIYPLHHSKFNFNETVLLTGVQLFFQLAKGESL